MSINKTGHSSSSAADNDLQFSPQDLNDLAIRYDLGLPDINDIQVVDDAVSNESALLSSVSVGQTQSILEDNQHIDGDVDMDTIVIESINSGSDMDVVGDELVFSNVANEVSISSSSPFERQNQLNTPTFKTNQVIRRDRPKSVASKVRATTTAQSVQPIRVQNPVVTTTQTQMIPISAMNLSHLNTAQLIPTTITSQTIKQNAKVIKKPITTTTTSILPTHIDSQTTLKVIYTSQGQQIIFSPQKQSNLNVVNLGNAANVAPAGKVLLKPVTQTMTKTLANIPSNQSQQVIILSPVKASSTITSISPATTKILPVKPQQILAAAKSPQRVLAPAPAPQMSKIAISKTMPPSHDIKSVQLIRVVPISSAQAIPQMSANSISTSKLALRPIAPNTRPIAPITQTHKVIVSSALTGKPTPITLSTSTASNLSQTFISTSVPSNTGQVFMLPNSSLLKLTPTTSTVTTVNSSKSVSFANPPSTQRTNFVPIAPSPMTSSATSTNPALTAAQLSSLKITNGSTKVEDPHQRKPCNCTKSQCLKLYCDCFANGEFCSSCNCISCHNNLDHEEDRQKAIRQCLERNPHAFHPKIGKGRAGDTERRHTKGCNCRRSGCLKNYCECYEAKILCSGLCKCVGCKNFEESFERKTLMHLADAAEVRSAQQNVATKNRLWSGDFKPKLPIRIDGDRLPCTFITPEVIEATCQCLLAQAEHGEKSDLDYKGIETLVLEEFGRCLTQIIDCASKTRTSKFKQESI